MAEAFDMTDPVLTGAAPSSEGVVPAGAGTGEPVATAEATPTETQETTQEQAPTETADARAQREAISRAAAELSMAGRIKKVNEENAALKAELAEKTRLLTDENARVDKIWQDAIAASPEVSDDPRIATRAELQRQFDLEKRQRVIEQKEQAQEFTARQVKEREEAFRAESAQQARHYATAELPGIINQIAQHEGLPPDLLKPVKEYVDSPQMRALARHLPLHSATQLPGDPATWPLERIDNLDHLRLYLEAQARDGITYYKQQHEQRQIATNVAQATATYQPERVVGAGVSAPKRDLSRYRNTNNIEAVLNIEDGIDP
ncbi:MAG: hypothetical protein KBF28_03815 [Gemmatimonadales bacterium]|nr:hypothetical protein [Gemmatimonadales bacterium]